jgi:hypothetical protein
LIYCKIDVEKKISEFKKTAENSAEVFVETLPKIKIKISEIENELATNKKLIEMTSGNEDGDGDEGSDS